MNIKHSSFKKIFLGFLKLVVLVFILVSFNGCTSLKQPQIISLRLENISANSKSFGEIDAIDLTMLAEVDNPNSSAIDFTVNNLVININNKPIGYLVKATPYTLKPEAVSRLSIALRMDQGVIVQMLLFGQLREKVTLDIVGDVVVHHSSGEYVYKIAERQVISLADLGL